MIYLARSQSNIKNRPFKISLMWFVLACLVIFLLLLHSANATPAMPLSYLSRKFSELGQWQNFYLDFAKRLFWTLAIISFVWSMGALILRGADTLEFMGELFRYFIFIGVYWWLLTNGTQLTLDILRSLQLLSFKTVGIDFGPVTFMQYGVSYFVDMLSPLSSVSYNYAYIITLLNFGTLIGFMVICLVYIGYVCKSWFLAYTGIFLLGFGGARWTSDLVIGYFKHVLSVGMSLWGVTAAMGVAKMYVINYYLALHGKYTLSDLASFFVVVWSAAILNYMLPKMMTKLVNSQSLSSISLAAFAAPFNQTRYNNPVSIPETRATTNPEVKAVLEASKSANIHNNSTPILYANPVVTTYPATVNNTVARSLTPLQTFMGVSNLSNPAIRPPTVFVNAPAASSSMSASGLSETGISSTVSASRIGGGSQSSFQGHAANNSSGSASSNMSATSAGSNNASTAPNSNFSGNNNRAMDKSSMGSAGSDHKASHGNINIPNQGGVVESVQTRVTQSMNIASTVVPDPLAMRRSLSPSIYNQADYENSFFSAVKHIDRKTSGVLSNVASPDIIDNLNQEVNRVTQIYKNQNQRSDTTNISSKTTSTLDRKHNKPFNDPKLNK